MNSSIIMDNFKEITIIDLVDETECELNEKIKSFSNSLGMFNKRDKEKSCFRIFVNLLKAKNPISSDEIAERSRLSRATVIHHITKLRDSGIVIKKQTGYTLKTRSLEELTNEIEKDIFQTLERLKKISRQIDRELEDEFW